MVQLKGFLVHAPDPDDCQIASARYFLPNRSPRARAPSSSSRRFLDREDLERQLRDWLTEANTVRPSRATGVTPAARMDEERARLRPLKIVPADLALRIPVSVSATGVVMHNGHPYSMPPDAIGLPGTLYLYRDRVRIIAGRFRSDHTRKFQPGESSILPEHRAERVAAVSGKRARRYLQRQHVLDGGALFRVVGGFFVLLGLALLVFVGTAVFVLVDSISD